MFSGRRAAPVAGLNVSRKNTVGVVLSRLSAGIPALPGTIFHQCWAASTNVRSSAAPLTQVKTLYGWGGRTVASTCPVTVERTSARRGSACTGSASSTK